MIRLFDPAGDRDYRPAPTDDLITFFSRWYVPAIQSRTDRRPPSAKTIARRRAAVNWWQRTMATPAQPAGPALFEIDADALIRFRDELKSATYRRGKLAPSRKLTPFTIARTIDEIQTVLAAAGPPDGSRIRAGIIDRPPTIWVDRPPIYPKPTWSIEEARAIAAAAIAARPPRFWPLSMAAYRDLSRATIAFWYYSGHRATTYRRLYWSQMTEPEPGLQCVDIVATKTGKPDRLVIPPELLSAFDRLRGLDAKQIIPWPVSYSALAKHALRWQMAAGLPKSRQFSPQAWRRLHARQIARVGLAMASDIAAGSLQHYSGATTAGHYAPIKDMARLRLPPLFVG